MIKYLYHFEYCISRGVKKKLGTKTILVRLSEDQYNDIHRLMGYTLVSADKEIIIDRMHTGSKQDFYRKVMQKGINAIKKEWDDKVKKYESQDDN